jgi:hypothetical protein
VFEGENLDRVQIIRPDPNHYCCRCRCPSRSELLDSCPACFLHHIFNLLVIFQIRMATLTMRAKEMQLIFSSKGSLMMIMITMMTVIRDKESHTKIKMRWRYFYIRICCSF